MTRTDNSIRNYKSLIRALTSPFKSILTQFRAPEPIQTLAAPPRRPLSVQWERINGVLCEAQSRVKRISENQGRAAAQLDSATYALQKLREEVRPAFHYTVSRPAPAPVVPSAFRASQFRRSLPLAA